MIPPPTTYDIIDTPNKIKREKNIDLKVALVNRREHDKR